MTTTDKPYKVLIPCAGTGSRLGSLTKYLNKALVDVSGMPALSRIIEMFSDNAEFVIVLGFKGELIKQFLSLAYPNRKFIFSQVQKFYGEGSGLGLSVLSAEKYLQEPFVFCSCDTIVDEKNIFPDKNIAFYSLKEDKNQYRTLKIQGNKVISVLEKKQSQSDSEAYIGLCCINDYALFWEEMHKGGEAAVETGECYALKKFAQKNILFAQKTVWFDTGNPEKLEKTREHFVKPDAPNILPKPDEAIWFVNGRVIKYSDNKKFISERCERTKYLKGFVPDIAEHTDNMYSYDEIEGKVLSKINDITLFKKLLEYSNDFWTKKDLNDKEKYDFYCSAKKFYYDKTISRVEQYYKTFERKDCAEIINGVSCPELIDIFYKFDWDKICFGVAGRFHGDFHFENILYNEKQDKFIFIDWRQNFGGLLEYGDIYYDLAKLLHGLIICHELIAKNRFDVSLNGNVINYSFERKQILIECEKYYYDWLKGNGYDVRKVKILTALIYLNIAALHHYPYCHLLYYLGKTMLFENIIQNEV